MFPLQAPLHYGYCLLLLVLQTAAAFLHFPREVNGGGAPPGVLLLEAIAQ